MEITVMIWVRDGKETGMSLAPPDPSSVACPALSSPFASAGAALSQVELLGALRDGWGSVYSILISSSRALSPAWQDLPGQSPFTAVSA